MSENKEEKVENKKEGEEPERHYIVRNRRKIIVWNPEGKIDRSKRSVKTPDISAANIVASERRRKKPQNVYEVEATLGSRTRESNKRKKSLEESEDEDEKPSKSKKRKTDSSSGVVEQPKKKKKQEKPEKATTKEEKKEEAKRPTALSPKIVSILEKELNAKYEEKPRRKYVNHAYLMPKHIQEFLDYKLPHYYYKSAKKNFFDVHFGDFAVEDPVDWLQKNPDGMLIGEGDLLFGVRCKVCFSIFLHFSTKESQFFSYFFIF